MRSALLAAIAFVMALPAESSAHRLDEYLQAARLSLARDRIELELDLTPGASIASTIVALLDRDGDNTISPIEAGAYGQGVLSDLVLEFDDRPIALALTRVEIPSIDEMRDGLGTIQLRAVGHVKAVTGRRRLHFRNNHRPGESVYLVNALVPPDRGVGVLIQTRDPRQQGVEVAYNVDAQWPVRLLWLIVGAAGLSGLIVIRRTRNSGFKELRWPATHTS